MRKVIGAGTVVVGLLCFVFAARIGANLVDSYDEEIQDWVFVVVTLVALAAGLACLRLGIRSLRSAGARRPARP